MVADRWGSPNLNQVLFFPRSLPIRRPYRTRRVRGERERTHRNCRKGHSPTKGEKRKTTHNLLDPNNFAETDYCWDVESPTHKSPSNNSSTSTTKAEPNTLVGVGEMKDREEIGENTVFYLFDLLFGVYSNVVYIQCSVVCIQNFGFLTDILNSNNLSHI